MSKITDDMLQEIFERQTGAMNFDTIYEKGFQAASSGLEESENPFKSGTKEYQYWTDGWFDGFYEQGSGQLEYCRTEVNSDEPVCHSREGGNPGQSSGKTPTSKWIAIAGAAVAVAGISIGLLDLAA